MTNNKTFSVPPEYLSAFERLSENILFEHEIRKGANGYVVVGKNRVLDVRVVVKFYYWNKGLYAEPKKLFALQHPNVLKVMDAVAIDDSSAYFITPYCVSGDMDDLMRAGPVSSKEAVDIVSRVLSGLSHIHSAGFIHRDIKASNVFISNSGAPVIGDFGSVVEGNDKGFATTASKHAIIYRPPEDFSGNNFYRQGDIYQLGILLYQLLGGALPYDETSWLSKAEMLKYGSLSGFERQMVVDGAISKKICGGRLLDFDSIPCWIDPPLRRIIKKATNLRICDRYQSSSDFRSSLFAVQSSMLNWIHEGSCIVAHGRKKSLKIDQSNEFKVAKKVNGNWRNMSSGRNFPTLKAAVNFVRAEMSQ